MMIQNYTMGIYKSILINTRLFQMLRKLCWVINMILFIYLQTHITTMSGLKMNNRLIQVQEKVVKKNLQIYLKCQEQGEVKKRKRKILTAKQIVNQTSNIISTNKNWKQFKKLKKQIRQTLYLLYKNNKITKMVYKNLIKSL